MALIDVMMPKMGESIMEATILRWHKKPGETVKVDEPLMDIATDKVDSEVPSTAEGVLEEVLYQENDIVPVGAVFARIRTVAAEGEGVAESVPPKADATPEPAPLQPFGASEAVEADPVEEHAIPYQPTPPHSVKPAAGRFYSPLVLNIAHREGIGMAELEDIPGTGSEGRVTKKDILDYVAAGRKRSLPQTEKHTGSAAESDSSPMDRFFAPEREARREAPLPALQPQRPQPAAASPHTSGSVEVIEMDRMRRMIAEHMVKSKATSAHVTSFAEADVTHMVQWRERIKGDFEKREGTRITYTPLIIEAVVKCLKRHPLLNASVEGEKILLKRDINIGMATALESGNLIVPVIKGADQLNLVGLTRQVNHLAQSARNGRLKPDETQGGTFTFTNVGSFGSLMGTPIINQPQVAILAAGVIKKKPVVLETAEGDSIAIRHMVFLSLSYDHRIIDGALGATFLSAVVRELEQFDGGRTI